MGQYTTSEQFDLMDSMVMLAKPPSSPFSTPIDPRITGTIAIVINSRRYNNLNPLIIMACACVLISKLLFILLMNNI